MGYMAEAGFEDMMYQIYIMAVFFVEYANLLVPYRENSNLKRLLARFTSFFKGFIGAGGRKMKALKPLGSGADSAKINMKTDSFMIERQKKKSSVFIASVMNHLLYGIYGLQPRRQFCYF